MIVARLKTLPEMKLKSIAIYCTFSAIMLYILLWQHAIRFADFRFYLIAAVIIGYIYYTETLAQKRRMSH